MLICLCVYLCIYDIVYLHIWMLVCAYACVCMCCFAYVHRCCMYDVKVAHLFIYLFMCLCKHSSEVWSQGLKNLLGKVNGNCNFRNPKAEYPSNVLNCTLVSTYWHGRDCQLRIPDGLVFHAYYPFECWPQSMLLNYMLLASVITTVPSHHFKSPYIFTCIWEYMQ